VCRAIGRRVAMGDGLTKYSTTRLLRRSKYSVTMKKMTSDAYGISKVKLLTKLSFSNILLFNCSNCGRIFMEDKGSCGYASTLQIQLSVIGFSVKNKERGFVNLRENVNFAAQNGRFIFNRKRTEENSYSKNIVSLNDLSFQQGRLSTGSIRILFVYLWT
jgi:hypothetical protein